ncbi:hypothetical protein JQ617_22670 [Bradyrhizobium sp. KB893862 SZCCT0404]|uniref:hypothetical protein n=1 Tax=Bradyrhizobium sp. KB893862 SZCCT0404 TaxID=2807672 RepID=UPI001BA97504|nr:hypothetical protein [Bradyrhizobium sp. KB893862 SZCCT0404]MBR1176771.1 hypothetical protein [Bradyrhizobium sp. KB893862 SZCCT0404]
MANLLADAQLALRAAGRGTLLLMMPWHGRKSPRHDRVWDTGIVIFPVETNAVRWPEKIRPSHSRYFSSKKIQSLR